MTVVEFSALEYQTDASFQEARYRYEGSPENGWRVLRHGEPHLDLPEGYRLLETLECGVCATDLARRYLPFPLPQIIGHEVLARDESGRLVAAEINASHYATGSAAAAGCPFCRAGLHTHCPERLVLGIDRLPGGFAPWILVPRRNVIEIPPEFPGESRVLVEPFAAALHASERMNLEGARRVAVLGVGRLGLLIVAALRITREARGHSFSIEAVDRQEKRLALARGLGADVVWSDFRNLPAAGGSPPVFDVVVEATGSQSGLEAALSLASREVHVKSTTGKETFGLRHLTELVVDEIALAPFRPRQDPLPPGVPGTTALLIGSRYDPQVRRRLEAGGFACKQVPRIEDFQPLKDRERPLADLQADVVAVDTLELMDSVLRPRPDLEQGLVRPRGTVLIVDVGQARPGLLGPLLDRGVRISTSRCGDFRKAIPAMQTLSRLGIDLGAVVTDRLPASRLAQAFERAGSPDSIKVVVSRTT